MPTNVAVFQRIFSKTHSPPDVTVKVSFHGGHRVQKIPYFFLSCNPWSLKLRHDALKHECLKSWLSQIRWKIVSMIYTCFHIHNRSRTKCSIYREKRQVYKNRAQRRGKEPICRNMNFAFLPKLQVDRIFIETTTYDVPTWRYEKVRVFQEVYDIHKKTGLYNASWSFALPIFRHRVCKKRVKFYENDQFSKGERYLWVSTLCSHTEKTLRKRCRISGTHAEIL